MTTKKCPICNQIKSTDEFYKYFSKERNKYRVSNYCITCGRSNSKVRVKKYYHENHEQRLKYHEEYRKNNKDKIKKLSAHFTKKYREELQDCYVAEFAAKSLKCSTKEIHDNPELLQAYKKNMELKRKIRHYGKEQTNRPK